MSDRKRYRSRGCQPTPGPSPGSGFQARCSSLQVSGHHDLYRVQSLRSGVRRVNDMPSARPPSTIPTDDAGDALELLEPDQVQRTSAKMERSSG